MIAMSISSAARAVDDTVKLNPLTRPTTEANAAVALNIRFVILILSSVINDLLRL